MIQVNLTNMQSFVTPNYETELAARVRDAHDKLQLGTGAGSDYIGWVRLPADYDKDEFARIQMLYGSMAHFKTKGSEYC